jgi:malate permease and related proteins
MEIALENIFAMYAIMLAAYGVQRVAPYSVKAVNDLVFHFFLPITVFYSIVKVPSFKPAAFLQMIVCSVLVLLLTFFLAQFIAGGLKLKGGFKRTFVLGATYGNHAFLGIPVAYAFLGDSGSALSVFFLIGSYKFLYSIGYFIMTGRTTLIGFFKNPLVISMGLGLLVAFLRLKLPPILLKSLSLVNQGTFPLSMVVVGGGLSFKFFGIGKKILHTLAAGSIKLVCAPALAYLVGIALSLSGEQTAICMLQAAMATGVLVSVFSVKYEGDVVFSNALVSLTTLGSIVTVPMLLWVLDRLF